MSTIPRRRFPFVSRARSAPPWSRVSIRAILAGTASFLLLTLCFPPFDLGWLAWVALVPILGVLPGLSYRGTEWLGFLTGLAFYAVGFRWFADLFGFPAVALWGLLALYMAAFAVLVRSLPPRMPVWGRALLAACFWVALEFVRSEQWALRFSWLALGYSQHNQFAILPAASWVGVYGLSFLIVAVGALAAWSRRGRVVFGPVAALAVLSLAASHRPPVSGIVMPGKAEAAVVLVQSDDLRRAHLYDLARQQTTSMGIPTLVVWPEYTIQQTEREAPDIYEEIRDQARRREATHVFGGMKDRGGDHYSSAAFVVGPDGRGLGVTLKHNPLPFFSDGLPGAEYPVYTWPRDGDARRFGVLICFDLSFERNARILARNGAEFLVVPSYEPPEWPRLEQSQHAIVAPLRAAENGVGIVRASSPGPSQVVDARGRVGPVLPVGRSGVVMSGPPYAFPRTVYNRAGWILPWACQAVTLAWVIGRLVLWARQRSVHTAGQMRLTV